MELWTTPILRDKTAQSSLDNLWMIISISIRHASLSAVLSVCVCVCLCVSLSCNFLSQVLIHQHLLYDDDDDDDDDGNDRATPPSSPSLLLHTFPFCRLYKTTYYILDLEKEEEIESFSPAQAKIFSFLFIE